MNLDNLVNTFHEMYKISKRQIHNKIKEIAAKEIRDAKPFKVGQIKYPMAGPQKFYKFFKMGNCFRLFLETEMLVC